MRKASILSAFLCGLSLLFLAATPASADPNAPGNNGSGNAGGTVTTGGSASGSTTTTIAASSSASAGVVAGVQFAPQAPQALAGVQSMPSTSTDTGQIPLVALGVLIFATGIVLLRRPAGTPNP
jgi:hypothetical protein